MMKRMWVLVTIPLLAAAATWYYYTEHHERKYRSAAQLFVEPPGGRRAVARAGDVPPPQENIGDHVEAMKTELIGSMVAYNLLLHDLEENAPFRDTGALLLSQAELDSAGAVLKEKLASFDLLSARHEFERMIMDVLERKKYDPSRWVAEGDLVIERMNDKDLIRISFLSENPFLSAFVVNSLSEEYIRYHNFMNNRDTGDSLLYFKAQAEKTKGMLDSLAGRLHRYKTVSLPDNTDRGRGHDAALLARYEDQLRDAGRKRKEVLARLQKVRSEMTYYEQPPQYPGSAKMRKLRELQSKIDELEKIYRDNGSKNKELAATIGRLRGQLQRETLKVETEAEKTAQYAKEREQLIARKNALEADYEQADAHYTDMQRKVRRLKNSPAEAEANTGAADSAALMLERRHEEALLAHNLATKKLKAARSATHDKNSAMKLMARGQPGAKPESPEAMLMVVAVAAGCTVLCLVVLLILERNYAPRKTIFPKLTVTR